MKFKKEIPSEIAEEPLFHASAFSFPDWKIITKEPEIQIMKWGLIPNWFHGSNTAEIASKTINARSETILEKPSFKHLIGRNHCVVPSTGFFEFQHVGKEKIPHFVYPAKDELFLMAGIYDTYKNPLTGIVTRSFSIITSEANEMMAEIHNIKKRMPILLGNDQWENWLQAPIQSIGDYFKMSPNDWWSAHKINPKIINEPKHNSPEVLLEYIDSRGVQGSLF